jgi:hypothetical protein
MDDLRAKLKRLIMELPEYDLASVYLQLERRIKNSQAKADDPETVKAEQ